MSEQGPCGFCGGTGMVTRYEPWERAHVLIDQQVAYAEQIGHELVSVDVEGSYPTALVLGTIYHGESAQEAVDRLLGDWFRRGSDGMPTSPLNDNGGFYRPVDPRFWDGAPRS